MKTLPKHYVIKKDENNPLWEKYIDWLNKEYGERFIGGLMYYGYDGAYVRGISCHGSIELFKNSPELITLEQWGEAVNGAKFIDYAAKIKDNKTMEQDLEDVFEQPKIEKYKAPYDLNFGSVKKGDIVTRGDFDNRGAMYLYLTEDGVFKFPPEWVEREWIPVYEVEKLEITDYYNYEDNTSTILIKGKLSQEIVDKIKKVL